MGNAWSLLEIETLSTRSGQISSSFWWESRDRKLYLFLNFMLILHLELVKRTGKLSILVTFFQVAYVTTLVCFDFLAKDKHTINQLTFIDFITFLIYLSFQYISFNETLHYFLQRRKLVFLVGLSSDILKYELCYLVLHSDISA